VGKRHRHQRSLCELLASLSSFEQPLWAVEIGVWEGETSEYLLTGLAELHLLLVDPWEATDEFVASSRRKNDIATTPQDALDAIAAKVRQRLSPFADRTTIWRMRSLQAAARLRDGTLGLAFIDAIHTDEKVTADTLAWWPKVQPGGILCWHDYSARPAPPCASPRPKCRRSPSPIRRGREHRGVKTAVDRWAADVGQTILVKPGRIAWTQQPKEGQ